MKFEIHAPCEQLKPYVKHFVISESDDMRSYKVLPGTSLVMGFQYAGNLSYLKDDKEHALSTAGITGLTDKYRIFKNSSQTGSILVIFHETGAARFFAAPLHELFGESLSLEHLFSRSELNETAEKLHAANTDKEKIGIIEQLLLNHLQDKQEDLLITKAVQYIYNSKGTIRISELADKLRTSQSPLEKRFRRIVGSSPKKFASIVRVKNVLSAFERNLNEDIPFIAGYYDQAHFIKDFKTFTALTPEQYLKEIKAPKT